MKIELLDITTNSELLIERCARICYDSLSKMPPDGSKLVTGCIKKGHLSILGHAKATFNISEVSRTLTHQLVRHRSMVFSQRSQRYVDEEGFRFVTPPKIRDNLEAHVIYQKAMNDIKNAYNLLKDRGISNEDARFALPNACVSNISVSATFESYMHFFRVRLDKHAQWEIRKLAEEMWKQLSKEAPKVFNAECLKAVPKRVFSLDIDPVKE